jgi:acetyl-CoA carboxylase carboxyl transferase subunit alpha
MAEQTKNAFERVQMARHPDRPYTNDLVSAVFTDFVELHGDRRYADDAAIVGGFARIEGIEVLVVGQQKGRDITQRRHRNFGMPKPEGYRKALGEGGSGGALAIGVGDRVLMLENSVYSVITPEGCAAILWKDKDASRSSQAAECLRLTAADLKTFGLIDEIIPELGIWKFPAEDNSPERKLFDESAQKIRKIILRHLIELNKLKIGERMDLRFQKFRNMGSWIT